MFDRLRKQLQAVEDEPGGISLLDIVDMPYPQRGMMLVMLRGVEQMTLEEIASALKTLPEAHRPPGDAVFQCLDDLVSTGWLIQFGEGEQVSYRINLRRKPGSQRPFGLWSLLGERLQD